MSKRERLAWVAAVGFVAFFGLGEFARWILESVRGPSWWAIDLNLVLRAGERLRAGAALYSDPAFLYPPAAALLGAALGLVDPFALSLLWAALKVGLALEAVRRWTPTWRLADRVLACLALVLSLPFLHDVMLGNVNTLLVAAIALAVLGRPSTRYGIPLGLLAALFAKPLLLPVGLWLLVFRRRVLAGAIATGLAATVLAVAATGPAAYVAWPSALLGGGRLASAFAGNHGVSALVPEAWLPVAATTGFALLMVLARRPAHVGLVWAVTSGILIAPYAGTYSALPIAIAVAVIGPTAPRVALAIVAVSPIATTYPLPFYAASILVAALVVRGPSPLGSAAAGPPNAASSVINW